MPTQSFDSEGRRLLGDDFLDSMPTEFEARIARERHVFTCSLCKDSVPVRDEHLQPILDKLAENGLRSISLAGLRGRL